MTRRQLIGSGLALLLAPFVKVQEPPTPEQVCTRDGHILDGKVPSIFLSIGTTWRRLKVCSRCQAVLWELAAVDIEYANRA